MRIWPLFILLSISFISCQKNSSSNTLFELLDAKETGIDFINEVKETKEFNVHTYRNFYNGGGVAMGDINNDGLPDIYFTSNQHENKLYLNKGNFTFEDITKKAGVEGKNEWSTGVVMADINDDGFMDIYVCNSGGLDGQKKENEVFINNGDLTFTEKGAELNLNNAGFGTHAAFFDYDQDGDLDCYILNNSFKNPSKIELYKSMRDKPDLMGGDRLMRNDNGIFVDVSQKAGIYSSEIGFGLGVAIGDLNQDNLPDIYISNDFWERDYLYLNNGDGTFKEDLTNRINYTSVSSMGADIADINGDGFPEIFTTDMLAGDNNRIQSMVNFDPYHLEDLKYRANYHYQMIQNCLQLNDGDANFQEVALLSGVAATDWSWGALIFDFQNDGTKDIFVANGINKDIMSGDFRDFMSSSNIQKELTTSPETFDFVALSKEIPSNPLKNAAFINKGELKFENSADDLGLGTPSFSNGSVYADLDNDGDLDLVVNNVNMPSFVYRNNADKLYQNNYLKITFKGPKGNSKGLGAKVTLKTNAGVQVMENYMNRGFESSLEPNLIFGLGKETITELMVVWPDGKSQTLKNVKENQTLSLEYNNAVLMPINSNKSVTETWFKDVTASIIRGNTNHVENKYNDFDQEILLNSLLSTEGPRLVVGDANGDKLDDFILLGAKDDADKLFLQNKDGSFSSGNNTPFYKDKNFESTCGSFLDYDMDGDMDLLIGSGGNQINVEQINFIVRLYTNDGKGNFTVSPSKIPPAVGNFSTLEVSDYDQDGDPDFFLGARTVPGNYGLSPRSFLFRNDKGTWTDISTEALGNIGMVTDAAWEDCDQDGDVDLIVVGDWMSIHIFRNNGGILSIPEVIPNSTGWWTRVEPQDVDGDGDMDFILGNWGQNSKFQASTSIPLKMYVNDFDDNGKSEFIINWKAPLDNKIYPFASKMDLTMQMPSLKKKNLKYEQFAKMSYEELFDADKTSNAKAYTAENLNTSILWNDNGNYVLKALPVEAQVSPVFGIIAKDFNKDGIIDIWLGGNFYGLKPQAGRHDASRGVLLKGLGNQKFQSISPKESGLYITGEVRDAFSLGSNILIARNDEGLKVYKSIK
jgi:enediyne biosynthesis protein E4